MAIFAGKYTATFIMDMQYERDIEESRRTRKQADDELEQAREELCKAHEVLAQAREVVGSSNENG